MSDLISRNVSIRMLRNYAECKFSNGEIELANGILKAVNYIENDNIPTSFDLESAIDTFEKYKLQQAENEMLSDNGKWLAQRIIEECEKILKSAENATNGKNGG